MVTFYMFPHTDSLKWETGKNIIALPAPETNVAAERDK